MFCNNCGNELKENARFCPQCGTSVVEKKKALCCPNCGKEAEPDTKFCNACGASLKVDAPTKIFCSSCGQELAENEPFCPNCGQGAGKKAAQKNTSDLSVKEKASRFTNDTVKKLAFSKEANVSDQTLSLAFKYLAMACLFALLLVFWFVPSITLEVPMGGWLSKELESFSLSMGNPYGSEGVQELMGEDASAMQGFSVFSTVIFFVAPTVLAGLFCFLPVKKRSFERRNRFILQKIVAIYALASYLFNLMSLKFVCSAAEDSYGKLAPSAGMSFGGFLLILICVGLIVLSFMTSKQTKQYDDTKKTNIGEEK